MLLRPVVQDYLLPALCYVGGPAEVAYFAQVQVVYRTMGRKVTPIAPRLGATVVEPRQAKLLDRYGLEVAETFVGREKLAEIVAAKVVPEDLMRNFDQAEERLEHDLKRIREGLEVLDKTLVDAAENAGSKMRYQLQGLRDKTVRAEARKNSELQHHADELSTFLYPNKELQERGTGSAYWLLQHGFGLVEILEHAAAGCCPDHQVIVLDRTS